MGDLRCWGVEGAWNYGRGLAQFLVQAAEVVYEINPRWTAMSRRKARRQGKNDRLDARAVAALVRQEAGTLPRVHQEDETAIIDMLVKEREDVLAEATRLRNQIHQLLLQIDPEYSLHLPNLQSKAGLRALETYSPQRVSELQLQRAAAVRRLAQRLRLAVEQVADLTKQIKKLAEARFSPLTRLCGIDLLTAAALAGILGPQGRFMSDSQLASYAGVAPLEASSAGTARHRLNHGGNRRLNAILYRIVLTQSRYSAQAKEYLQRRMSEGKTRREAVRALKRKAFRLSSAFIQNAPCCAIAANRFRSTWEASSWFTRKTSTCASKRKTRRYKLSRS